LSASIDGLVKVTIDERELRAGDVVDLGWCAPKLVTRMEGGLKHPSLGPFRIAHFAGDGASGCSFFPGEDAVVWRKR
jgi:hypothetical protein